MLPLGKGKILFRAVASAFPKNPLSSIRINKQSPLCFLMRLVPKRIRHFDLQNSSLCIYISRSPIADIMTVLSFPKRQFRCIHDSIFRNKWHMNTEDRVQPRFTIELDRKSTRLNSSHVSISYAVFCLNKKKHELTSTI